MSVMNPEDAVPKSRVLLSIYCKGLQNKDSLSKSDPFCVVQEKAPNGLWRDVGRTEVCKNNLNPKFKTKIEMDFTFEKKQELKFTLYDCDSVSKSIDQHDFLGTFETTMGSIVGSRGCCQHGVLTATKGQNEKLYGSISILGEEIQSEGSSDVKFKLGGVGLKTRDWMGKGDHYFIVKRRRRDGQLDEVKLPPPFSGKLVTEVIKGSGSPTFKEIALPCRNLNLGNLDTEIVVESWDWNSVSAHDFLGSATFTMAAVLANGGKLTAPFKKEKKGTADTKDRGQLVVSDFTVIKAVTMLDFIAGGTQINLLVAIDFTASNKDPKETTSLHYMNPAGFNAYQTAIINVGEILEKYDYDKQFPCYGFGAMLPSGQVSHCFALNGSETNPNCQQVIGVLEAYKRCLSNVSLYGPTNFAEIISMSTHKARTASQDAYFVLLIITDGEINDLDRTIDAIVEASERPLSIIIVGVGEADFTNMNALDSDDKCLTNSSGKKSTRDVVQFVALRECLNNGAELAARVLAEVPKQLTTYMGMKGIKPNARIPPPASQNLFAPPPAATANFGMHAMQASLPAQAAAAYPPPPPPAQGAYAPPPPPASSPPPPASLPPGWEEKIDAGSGKVYYQNHVTRCTQWDRPF